MKDSFKDRIKSFFSPTKQTKIDKTGRGYVCLDCDNSELFQGTSELYRLYLKRSEDWMDFDDEIVCPYEQMTCEECSSSNIGFEIRKGKIIKDHRVNGTSGLCLIGSRKLVDFNSPEIDAQLFSAMGGYEDLFEYGIVMFRNRLFDLEVDEESFRSKFVIVEIVSRGYIRQDEHGLLDEDSGYVSKRAAFFD